MWKIFENLILFVMWYLIVWKKERQKGESDFGGEE